MTQFLLIAAAHFLALLSPGPDFFLIVRTAAASGRRAGSAVSAWIAVGNLVFIVAAFAGLSLLDPAGIVFAVIQLAGSGYLVSLAVSFWRHAGSEELRLSAGDSEPARRLSSAFAAGLGSALLNPKNALFYASLAAMLTGWLATSLGRIGLASWLVLVVLGWDLLVAHAMGAQRLRNRFARALPWLERSCALVMLLLAGGIVWSVINRSVGA